MKRALKKLLGPARMAQVKRALSRFVARDLNKLARLYGSDKWNYHWYTQHYQSHFRKLRRRRLNILEIGVGGYESPTEGGESLRMWKSFFPRGQINGIDIHDKSALQEKRIRIFKGSQADEEFLKKVESEIGTLDIIIDDGSHVCRHVITSFQTLFPLLSNNGIYVIEDTQTSYWPEFGGNSDALNAPDTSLGLVKSLIDSINHKEMLKPGYQPTYADQHIVSIHVYHNIVFIYKGDNDEASTRVRDGVLGAPVKRTYSP